MIAETGQFVTFGASHGAAAAVIAAVGIGVILLAKLSRSAKLTRWVGWIMAAALLANELTYLACSYATKSWPDFLRYSLPLHICGVGAYLTVWVLASGNRRAFEVAYIWGIGGALQALVTPNIVLDWPSYWYVTFFITHGGIVIGVLYAAIVMGVRPRRGVILRVFVITNVFMVFVAGMDWLLEANYMFLCQRPHGDTPLFFLPWPWYLLFMEVVGVALGCLVCLPFWLTRGRSARQPAA